MMPGTWGDETPDPEKEEVKRDKLEQKADKLERKLDALKAKVGKIEAKADKLEKKADALEKKLDKLEAKLDKLEKKKDEKKKKTTTGKIRGIGSLLPRRRAELARVTEMLRSAVALAQPARDADLDSPALTRARRARRADGNEQELDRQEAELDKAEKSYDKAEKDLDVVEGKLDKAEKAYDAWEKDLDEDEKTYDDLEKLLDKQKTGGDPKKGRGVTRRIGRPSAGTSGRGTRARASDLLAEMRRGGARGRRAAQRLERLGASATPALLEAYDTPDEHFRWEIVNLLGYTRDPRAIPLLARRGIHDTEVHPRWRSIWALTAVDDGTAQETLRSQVRRASGIRRRNAAVALSLFDDHTAVPVLRKGLRAADAWVRWESASCLIGYADLRSAEEILKLYPFEPDASVRKEMIRALAGVGDPRVHRFLAQRLRDEEVEVRLAAVYALGLMGLHTSRTILSAGLRGERNSEVRREIRSALDALSEAG